MSLRPMRSNFRALMRVRLKGKSAQDLQDYLADLRDTLRTLRDYYREAESELRKCGDLEYQRRRLASERLHKLASQQAQTLHRIAIVVNRLGAGVDT